MNTFATPYHCCTHRDGSCRNNSVSNNPDKLWTGTVLKPLDQWNDGTSTLHSGRPGHCRRPEALQRQRIPEFPTHRRSPHATRLRSRPPLSYDGESGYEVISVTETSTAHARAAHSPRCATSIAHSQRWRMVHFEITVADKTSLSALTEPKLSDMADRNIHIAQEHARQLLSQGSIALQGIHGEVSFGSRHRTACAKEARNEADTLAPVDERTDEFRLQQRDFPVIDYTFT